MRPISVWKYYMNNKKRVCSLTITIFLVVFMLGIMRMLIDSLYYSTNAAWVQPKSRLSLVLPVATDKPLEQRTVESILNHSSVGKVVPVFYQDSYINNNLGGSASTHTFGLKSEDMDLMMKQMGLSVKEGRLPESGKKEIAMHWRIAVNKKLTIGDKVGSFLDKKEKLNGVYVIVGLLDGDSMVSFTSMEADVAVDGQTDLELNKRGLLVLPKDNSLDEMNQFISEIPPYEANWATYETGKESFRKATGMLGTTMTILEVLLIIILSLTAGLVCYIYFYQRRGELGLLLAIGYTKKHTVRRSLAEIGGMNFIGFLLGVLFSILVGLLLNALVYTPKGQPLQIWNLGYVARALTVPVSVAFFSFIPIWRLIRRLDPISIIEGVE